MKIIVKSICLIYEGFVELLMIRNFIKEKLQKNVNKMS